MKISKDSWHYKLVCGMNVDMEYKIRCGQVSDCQYIRKLLVSFLLLAVAIVIVTFFSVITVNALVLVPIYLFFDVELFNPFKDSAGILSGTVPLVVIVWVCTAIILVKLLSEQLWKRFKAKFAEKEEKKEVADNVVFAYIKAKKNKICSKVEII